MSIAFLIQSETQLKSGLQWVERFRSSSDVPLHVVVMGEDRTTLTQHAKHTFERAEGSVSIAQVGADSAEAIHYLRSAKCDVVVIVDNGHEGSFNESFFEVSPFQTIWLRANGPPPSTDSAVFSVQKKLSAFCRQSSMQFLGIAPTLHLSDEDWLSDDSNAEDVLNQLSAAVRQRCDQGDVIWIAIDSTFSTIQRTAVRSLLLDSKKASVILFRGSESIAESLSSGIRHWATHVAEPMDREQRIELARSLTEGSRPNLEFLGLISAAAMLAAFGLLQNSAAVIIGAMLVAPLMTPILGAGMALTHGNRPLFRSAIATISLGFAGALVSSFLFGCLVRLIQKPVITSEMWARCQPSPLDFCVGLVGGMAASYARTRSHLSSALAGAAIAAALVPPISTAGLQLAFGVFTPVEGEINRGLPVIGPLMLVTVNVLTIMIGSSFVLFARGMRIDDRRVSPGERWATRMTVLLMTLVMLVLVWVLHPSFLFGHPT